MKSDEGLFIPGLGEKESEYYEIKRYDITPSADTNIVMRLEFETSSDEIVNQRSVYTLLDFLGDCGGLLDSLLFLAQLIWYIVFSFSGSEINRYLIRRLFYKDKKNSDHNIDLDDTNDTQMKATKVLQSIKQQKPVVINRFHSCCCGRNKKSIKHAELKKKGMAKIEKELDIVNFIRQQKITQQAIKKLFNRFEYFLLKRQRSFVVDSASSTESSDDSYYQSQAALDV